ncbi:RNA degradosome polyphosphate kinase [Solemya velum gill symbiont]|uniref:Polyphosphate kinase n=2 Tax=Solemya velum gill symbiont TaxID=2340 RepID=A0A1T2N7K6_SOVGS|nr:polyphosphate kinase 1 [Solemya velum gill symbiont]OOY35440.1 RNA degradosome polyphosphate kinase [Solemya velum gill symbiont]OOY38607.1 RNA degradosome polyphosphate kinase [Solemya velum gill symbiont]OOY45303.1 RNA degradosome polyphosphate kinase [Solemya velum gill symbiont]OOY48984.1 RNA degradosome polyphosphate kinase [Solemya velum gill symbiont]OOY51038.1 RNA degradosome polyphosphate kinase [Solemya velum gill symbiont]
MSSEFTPDLFINRELSNLQFNRRVLELSQDTSVPLLERLRFMCISCSNLDEFFEVRAARLKQQQMHNIDPQDPAGMSAAQQLEAISKEAHSLVKEQYIVFNQQLIPELEAENIHFLRRSAWTEQQSNWLNNHFKRELAPLLSPLGLDHAHPFPRILNKSLNFIVQLEGKDAFGRDSGMAIVQAPRALPRIIRLPEEISPSPDTFVFLSSVIHAHVDDLFPGMTSLGSYQFRVTRNSDLFVSEEADDLMLALKGELLSRNYGDEVRLEVADDIQPRLKNYLVEKCRLDEQDVYPVNGPVNLSRLAAVVDMVDRPELKFPAIRPGFPEDFVTDQDIFDYISDKRYVLMHHPYQSFDPVVNLVQQAAVDKKVVAIKMTLYRTGSKSQIADALVAAARAGKEVTAVIELRARFDEEANIALATRLQDAGAYVAYGVVGHKTHAKMTLVVRRQGRRLKRFVHLGTGNYHAGTAKAYTDYGMLSDDSALGSDVHRLFLQLTGLGKSLNLKKMLSAPFTLHSSMVKFIRHEAEHARAGRKALIRAKMNSLIEPKIIEELYKASQAGVKIELIVRGVCGIRPGIKGVSENIHVRSIMGRFLEHTRVFYFYNDGEENLYCASADWMGRNFFKRIESCFPVEQYALKRRIIKETFTTHLRDNCQSWVLKSNGTYKRVKPSKRAKPRNAHEILIEMMQG